jgi:hypothetical protein
MPYSLLRCAYDAMLFLHYRVLLRPVLCWRSPFYVVNDGPHGRVNRATLAKGNHLHEHHDQ